MKYIYNFVLILFVLPLSAQSNYLEIGVGRGFITSGDGRAWSFNNEYKKEIRPGRSLVGGGISLHYSFADNIGINVSPGEIPYTVVDRNGTYPFPDFIPGEPFEHQSGKILKTKTEQHLYINFDFFYTIRLGAIEPNKLWEKSVAFGPTINYTSQTYIAEEVSGVFTSNFYPSTNVRLTVPYYKRLLTLGAHFKADIARKVGQKSAIGLSGRLFANINSDWVYSYALFWRVGF